MTKTNYYVHNEMDDKRLYIKTQTIGEQGHVCEDLMLFLSGDQTRAKRLTSALNRLSRMEERLDQLTAEWQTKLLEYERYAKEHSETEGRRPTLLALTKLELEVNCLDKQRSLLKEFIQI